MVPGIGFIGLGIMGREMARNLLERGGYTLNVYNRSRDKCDPLSKKGALVHNTPGEVAAHSHTIILMLSESNAVRDILEGEDGVLGEMKDGKILIDMGTNTPLFNEEVERMVEEKGGHYLEAPVLGSREPARERTLTLLVGGEEAIFENVRTILTSIGKKIVYMGKVGMASQMKLVVNQIMAGMLALFSEGVIAGERSGIPPGKILEVIENSAINTPLFKVKGANMLLSHDFYPQFPLKHAQKDLRQALEVADKLGVPTPVTAAANALYLLASDMGFREEDFSSVIKTLMRGDGEIHIDY